MGRKSIYRGRPASDCPECGKPMPEGNRLCGDCLRIEHAKQRDEEAKRRAEEKAALDKRILNYRAIKDMQIPGQDPDSDLNVSGLVAKALNTLYEVPVEAIEDNGWSCPVCKSQDALVGIAYNKGSDRNYMTMTCFGCGEMFALAEDKGMRIIKIYRGLELSPIQDNELLEAAASTKPPCSVCWGKNSWELILRGPEAVLRCKRCGNNTRIN